MIGQYTAAGNRRSEPYLADGIFAQSARAIAKRVVAGEISARSVTGMFLNRIADVNPTLNGIITLVPDEAMAAAARVDDIIASKGNPGPLAGVPFTVKDLIATKGIRTTAGSRVLRDYVPSVEAPAVTRLKNAGAILLGKTNCSEFALDLHTTNLLFGGTKNPWDLRRTPGGSSGGEAAAVASGCSAFGIGTDYGGSIRWPAHCTALYGLRPSRGLVPDSGQLPYSAARCLPAFEEASWCQPPNSVSLQSQLQRVAPIARYPEDIWAVLSVIAGPHPSDPAAVPVPMRDPATSIRGMRVAWTFSDGNFPIAQEVRDAMTLVTDRLAGIGATLTECTPPSFAKAESIFDLMRRADGLPDHLRAVGVLLSEVGDNLKEWFSAVSTSTVSEYRALAAERDALAASFVALFDRFDAFITPVAGIPAFTDMQTTFNISGIEVPRFNVLNCSRAISALNVPALAMPVSVTATGVPIGVQVASAPFRDDVCVSIATALSADFNPWRRQVDLEL